MIEETAWDILLALHSDRRCELSLAKLASLVSVTPAGIEPVARRRSNSGKLITGAKHSSTGELRAILTPRAASCSTNICRRPATCRSELATKSLISNRGDECECVCVKKKNDWKSFG